MVCSARPALIIGNGRINADVRCADASDTIALYEGAVAAARLVVNLDIKPAAPVAATLNTDIATATATTDIGGITVERTFLASFIEKVVLVRLAAKQDGRLLPPDKCPALLKPHIAFIAPEGQDKDDTKIAKYDNVTASAHTNTGDSEAYAYARTVADNQGVTVYIAVAGDTITPTQAHNTQERALYALGAFTDRVRASDRSKRRVNYYTATYEAHCRSYISRRPTIALTISDSQGRKPAESWKAARYVTAILPTPELQAAAMRRLVPGTTYDIGQALRVPEQLIQEHGTTLALLPTLPQEWADGEIDSLALSSGLHIKKLQWRGGALNHLIIQTGEERDLTLQYAGGALHRVHRKRILEQGLKAKYRTEIKLEPITTTLHISPREWIEVISDKTTLK